MKVVNEKQHNHSNSINNVLTKSTEDEEDSDNENLSPLLNNSKSTTKLNENLENSALKMDGVEESIDDVSDMEGDHNSHKV